MSNGMKKLPEAEDQTRTVGFEQAAENVIPIRQGHCPQCLQPMGMKDVQKAARINVVTANGNDQWCQRCYEKGLKEKICVKYEKLSKKVRQKLRRNNLCQ